jgi:hypothetical protein
MWSIPYFSETATMTTNNSITHPLFSKVRLHAAAAYNGPHSITIRAKDRSFYGWPTLVLELRSAKADRVESRTIYANLFDHTQEFAILRATFWDGVSSRKNFKEYPEFREHPEKFPVVLPARFVKISTRRLRSWLFEINGMSVKVSGVNAIDSKVDVVRKIRVEQDYVACVFEKVWQAEDRNHAILNNKWRKIWTGFSRALKTAPIIDKFTENFGLAVPVFWYDFDNFQPDLLD